MASITKLFTAVAVLQLVEQGKLRLDDRITEVIDLSGTEIPGDVTVEQLLNHTSGIADDADEEAGEITQRCFWTAPITGFGNAGISSGILPIKSLILPREPT